MDDQTIRKLVKRSDLRGLQSVGHHDVARFLLATLRDYEADPGPADFDRLMSVGILLAGSGHESADGPVLDWLLFAPSAKRLDIVSAFLNGLWNRVYRNSSVSDKSAEALVKARSQAKTVDDDTEYSFVQALCRVVESDASGAIKRKLVKILQQVQQRPFAPVLIHSVNQTVGRALQHYSSATKGP